MTPQTYPLFAKKSLTLVAALFGDGPLFALPVERLRQAQANIEIDRPGDKQWMRKVEPEGLAVQRGALAVALHADAGLPSAGCSAVFRAHQHLGNSCRSPCANRHRRDLAQHFRWRNVGRVFEMAARPQCRDGALAQQSLCSTSRRDVSQRRRRSLAVALRLSSAQQHSITGVHNHALSSPV